MAAFELLKKLRPFFRNFDWGVITVGTLSTANFQPFLATVPAPFWPPSNVSVNISEAGLTGSRPK